MRKGGTGQTRALKENADYGDPKEREGQQEHHGWKSGGRRAPGVSRGQCKGKQTKNDRRAESIQPGHDGSDPEHRTVILQHSSLSVGLSHLF